MLMNLLPAIVLPTERINARFSSFPITGTLVALCVCQVIFDSGCNIMPVSSMLQIDSMYILKSLHS